MNLNIRPSTTQDRALKYQDAEDEFFTIPDEQLHVFRQLINTQFNDINSFMRIDFVDTEPYGENPSITDMVKDFHAGRLLIHTTGNDSKVWGKFTNLQFRAVHDYIHCLHNIEFTHYFEIQAFRKQAEFSFRDRYMNLFPHLNWETYVGILRSEIVYQSAYKEYFGLFHINQKIVLKEL